jgi:beta-glucosidase
MKKYLIGAACIFIAACVSAQPFSFKNKSEKAVDKEIDKIIASMSLSEKVAQLHYLSFGSIQRFVDAQGNVNADSLRKYFPYGMGGFNISWTEAPERYVNIHNSLQKYALSLRKPIPIIFTGEGLHGAMISGATVFPQAIGLGCSWDTTLLEKVFAATALELKSRGINQVLGPVLDLGRDPRFGRIEEMYSEDPYLVAMLGKAAVFGFQGRSPKIDNNHIAATLKHFVAHGIPEGGRNIATVDISTYDIYNDHMYPFEVCIKQANVLSVMPSYNEINGVPNHGNKWLFDKVLRTDLGFKGLITSDQNAIDEMWRTHAVAPTLAMAACMAIKAGVDVDLAYAKPSYRYLDSLVKAGALSEDVINAAVKRLFTLKYKVSLFENYYSNVNYMLAVTNSKAHKALALESAHKSMVLLKNENNLLPLDSTRIKTIAVIGPNAKGVHFGGYSYEPRKGTDILDGITQFANGRFNVLYAEGCKISENIGSFWNNPTVAYNNPEEDKKQIEEAVKVASQSDVVLLTLGENESFSREGWGEDHRGDRASIELLGAQNKLVAELLKTGKPIVVLLINGRPLAINDIAKTVPAIIEGWYLGQEGGTAVADVLFGKVNPSGKLSVTFPKSTGELPCYYDRKPSRVRSYIGEENAPIFPFGFGLSYTHFDYSALSINKKEISKDETVTVSLTVKNSGTRSGDEIVQLYIRDKVSSAVRPIMELKDFARVTLAAGESKVVSFNLDAKKLAFYNAELKKVTEPGYFDVMVGPNSTNLSKVSFKLK